MIDDLNSSDTQRGQMAGESEFTRSLIDDIHCSDIEGNEIEG